MLPIASLLGALCLYSPQAPAHDRPNVLVLVLDDVALSDFDLLERPNMDWLASQGVSFRRGYTMPVCSPTRYCGLFGEYRGFFSGDACVDPLPETPRHSMVSLPKLLKARGYATGMFGKWHVGSNRLGAPELSPHLQGFDVARAMSPGNVIDCGGGTYSDWLRYDDGVITRESLYHTSAVRDELLTWWQATAEPKFAWVAFNAAHSPFHTPPPDLLSPDYPPPTTNRGRYEAMIASLDVVVGQILDQIDLRETWVFLLADNGTPADSKRPDQVKGRVKGSTFEDGVRVPFLVAGPGSRRGFESNVLVHVTDLMATIAELIGTEIPDGAAPDSVSFASCLRTANEKGRRHLICDYFPPENGAEVPGQPRGRDRAVVARVRGRLWKLRRKGEVVEQLFDLGADPGEQTPLDRSDPVYGVILLRLRGWLDAHEDS